MFDVLRSKSKFFLVLILILASFLRLWGLTKVPVSMFADELDVGYQAYSILKTGRDYMGNPWPLHFQSYSDIRTPLYIYAAVPTVSIFGISPLGVRLPAAIFGILGVWGIYLLSNQLVKVKFSIWHLKFGILPALVLAVSLWHLQYSRAAFEATMLLAFLIFCLYFFFRAIREPKYLWLSLTLLAFTPWIYSTAKLFTPMLLILLFVLWRNDLLSIKKKYLSRAAVAGLIVGLPIILGTLFGGGGMRFNYISIFSDPTTKPEVDYARLLDAQIRGQTANVIPKVVSRIVHNKATFWTEKIISNTFNAISFNFLFVNGDPNLRHSIRGVGQFYWIESIALILGLIYFFGFFKDNKIKALIGFWVLAGIIPSAITRDGGNHATRLILILPPLIFLISYGLEKSLGRANLHLSKLLIFIYFGIWILEFGFYQHNYWVDNPWQTERQWHAGFYEAITYIKQVEDNYQKIIISDKYDPPKIFFASYYPYHPDKWQRGYEKGSLPGFDYLERVDKFYFGHAGPINIYDLAQFMDNESLYIAAASEIPDNLIRKPLMVPSGLRLIKSVAFPSGEPAFYFFENASRIN